MPVADAVFAHQHRNGSGARTARHDPGFVHAPRGRMVADIGRSVVEVAGGHRKGRDPRFGEGLLAERSGLHGLLHAEPVIDRHDHIPFPGVIFEIRKEARIVAPAAHETAAEDEHQAGFGPAVGRERHVAVQPQRVGLLDGIDEGLLFDRLRITRRSGEERE